MKKVGATKHIFCLIAGLLLGGGAVQMASADVSHESSQLATAENSFGFDLLHYLQKSEAKTKNIFISPYSIATACSMAWYGAHGDTKSELGKALHLGVKADSNNFAELNKSIASLSNVCKFTNANAIFADTQFKFKAAFINDCKSNFSAECKTVSLNKPEGIQSVNDWAKEKTEGKIKSIIDKPPGDLAGILANAVYFKGKWNTPFKKELSSDAPFHNADGSKNNVKMMSLSGDLSAYVGQGFKAVALPYAGKRLKAYIFLPDSGTALDELIKQFSAANWKKWKSSFSTKPEAYLGLPRFTLEYSKGLVDALKSLGVTRAFTFEQADFSPMFETAQKIRIADVLHKTYVQVNEEGTEAAAVTAVVMQAETARFIPDKFSMTVDRPFIFAIADDTTDSILFLGAIQKLGPEQSK